MAHAIGPDVTSNSSTVPENHIGVNVKVSQFTLNGGTASSSTTFAMCRIPAGAKVVGAVLDWDNNDLSTTTGASIAVKSWTNGTSNGDILESTAISTQPQLSGPSYEILGYRHTASSQAVVVLTGFVGTGTATTIFTLQLQYICQDDGD
jgi:peptidoglycan hydrolase-like protein with peptidoglycan-binding domain